MTMDDIKKIAEETPFTVSDVASSVHSSKKFNLPLNLQFFAEGDPGDGDNKGDDPDNPKGDDPEGGEPPADDDNKEPKDEPKFTQKQLDKIVQDRVERAEKDKQDAIDEAKKLAKMSADQKKEYEFEKLQRENEKLKADKNKYELGKEATTILAESGITADDEILDFVVKGDAEKTNNAVKAFTSLIEKVSDEKMKEKLKGKSPKKQTGQQSTMTRDEIMKVQDTSKRHKLIHENIHLFR